MNRHSDNPFPAQRDMGNRAGLPEAAAAAWRPTG